MAESEKRVERLKISSKTRSIRIKGGKEEHEMRYYISSLPPQEPQLIAEVIRGYWSVENNCHWTLDVVFGEDDRAISEGKAPDNSRAIQMIIAKMLKTEKSFRKRLKANKFKASSDLEYLRKVLYVAKF